MFSELSSHLFTAELTDRYSLSKQVVGHFHSHHFPRDSHCQPSLDTGMGRGREGWRIEGRGEGGSKGEEIQDKAGCEMKSAIPITGTEFMPQLIYEYGIMYVSKLAA